MCGIIAAVIFGYFLEQLVQRRAIKNMQNKSVNKQRAHTLLKWNKGASHFYYTLQTKLHWSLAGRLFLHWCLAGRYSVLAHFLITQHQICNCLPPFCRQGSALRRVISGLLPINFRAVENVIVPTIRKAFEVGDRTRTPFCHAVLTF